LLLQVAGCANQGEGDRCDRRNGNIDCESPLLCLKVTGRGELCCPPAGQASTVPECTAEIVEPDAATVSDASDAATEPDVSDATQPDASEPEEAAVESGAEASFEAATTDSATDGAGE
jgi:hypothetical protein